MTSNVPETNERSALALPGARSALTLLLLINLFNYIDRYVLAATIPLIKETFFANGRVLDAGWLAAVVDWVNQSFSLKLEDTLVGLLNTAFMVSYMLTAPVFARLGERMSRWVIVAIGVLMWSLATGASGLAATFVMLFVMRCFVGVGEAAYGPVAPSIISDLYPVRIRGQVLSWFYIALPVGSALGFAIGGLIGHSHIGDWGASVIGVRQESWRWAFYVVVIPGIVLGLWSLLMRDPPRGQAEVTSPALAHAPAAAKWADYRILIRTPSYVYCTLGMAAMTFAFGGIAFWMTPYLEAKPGHPANLGSIAVIFGAIITVSGLSATLLGGWVGDKLRGRFPGSYFLVSGIAMLVGFPVFLLALRSPFPWTWVMIFITCFCLFFNTGPTNTILANVSPPRIRAAAFALNILVIHALGDVISPVVIGFLNDYFDHDMNKSFSLVGVAFVIGAVLWISGSRHLERDTRLAPTRLA